MFRISCSCACRPPPQVHRRLLYPEVPASPMQGFSQHAERPLNCSYVTLNRQYRIKKKGSMNGRNLRNCLIALCCIFSTVRTKLNWFSFYKINAILLLSVCDLQVAGSRPSTDSLFYSSSSTATLAYCNRDLLTVVSKNIQFRQKNEGQKGTSTLV